MPFSSLPVATPGPEYPTSPVNPAPIPTAYLASSRKRAMGHASAQIDATKVCSLIGDGTLGSNLIPPGAQSCIMTVEASDSSIPDGQVLIRFWMDGQWPDTVSGIPTYNGQSYEIGCVDDLNNFRMISTDGNQHVVQIQFFSAI